MKNEDIMIISLAIVVLIVGAVALLVTGMGLNLNDESPVMTSSPTLNNTTNLASNATGSLTRDTGISISEVSEQNSGITYSSSSYYDTSYSSYTGDSTGSNSEGSDYSGSDNTGEGSEAGQTSSDETSYSLN